MKITTASYSVETSWIKSRPSATVTISRQSNAVVAVVGGSAFHFLAVELNDEFRQHTENTFLAFAIAVYGPSKRNPNMPCAGSSYLRDLRDTLTSFA